ncbi:MAG: N-acylglucosamine 2-epimerase, partial [Lachnospiraceae bacterium]|nr:N-acylglucosamine 2-epimerase [Lachnospiraceae bacterium]
YIREHLLDKRNGSEWYWAVDADGKPLEKPIVEPWKCPYHNGRMCMEVVRRLSI